MASITLEEAKSYLTVDTVFEDELISGLLKSARAMATDVARLKADDVKRLDNITERDETVCIRGETIPVSDALQWQALMHAATYCALGAMYQERDALDANKLKLALRSILYPIREGFEWGAVP